MTFVLAAAPKATAKGDNYFYGRTSFSDGWLRSRREGKPIFITKSFTI